MNQNHAPIGKRLERMRRAHGQAKRAGADRLVNAIAQQMWQETLNGRRSDAPRDIFDGSEFEIHLTARLQAN